MVLQLPNILTIFFGKKIKNAVNMSLWKTYSGDTFTGYFLANYVMGIDVTECLTLASTASAISVTRKGASNSIPLKEEVVNY